MKCKRQTQRFPFYFSRDTIPRAPGHRLACSLQLIHKLLKHFMKLLHTAAAHKCLMHFSCDDPLTTPLFSMNHKYIQGLLLFILGETILSKTMIRWITVKLYD